MFRMYASHSHSYTHLILALGIVREPTVWVLHFITSQYPGIHDIGLPAYYSAMLSCKELPRYQPSWSRAIPDGQPFSVQLGWKMCTALLTLNNSIITNIVIHT